LVKNPRYRPLPPTDAKNTEKARSAYLAAREGTALEIRRLLTVWLTLTAALVLLSYFTRPYFNTYTSADNDFAHFLAGETLSELEQIPIEDDSVPGANRLKRLEDGESRFAEWKYAATHFKGLLAEDFVFAFALAEEGCRLGLETQADPGGDRRRLAKAMLRRAQEQFRLIAAKDYRHSCQKGR